MDDIYKNYMLKLGFEIKEKIGSGLSGNTVRAYQKSLNRHVAIKFFNNIVNKSNGDLKKKFFRESQLLAELQHPSIPYVITQGLIPNNEGGIPYIVMQYISDITLEEYIKKNTQISLEEVLHISFQVLDALSFVHKKGIVHRDIKPENIMLLPSGHCYIIDFSIGFKVNPTQEGLTRITRTGDGLGSIQYMPPEQRYDMKNVDHRADIYSFSLVLCKMLIGKPEVSELNNDKKLYPTALKKAVTKGCDYDAGQRFSNAADFLRELKQISKSSNLFSSPAKLAICNGFKCSSAKWSPSGYYKKPYFLEESTDPFCKSCGTELIYQCRDCGGEVGTDMFCGGCGTQIFSIPECDKCGSFLKKIDMGKDTKEHGCDRCRNDNYLSKSVPQQPAPYDFKDDIPF